MREAEVLDRALSGEEHPSPAVADLVRLANGLEQAWAASPSPAASRRGLALALDAFEGNGQVVSLPPRVSRARRIVAGTAVAVAALIAVPGIARAASDDALPGDLMYPVKLGFEQLRLALADDPAEEAAIHLTLSDRRLAEAVLSKVLERRTAEREAVRRYTASIVAFEENTEQARALGLDVAVLVSRADVLLEKQNDVLAALIAQPPDPAVPGIRRAMEAVQKADGLGGERSRGAEKADKEARDKGAEEKKGKDAPRHGKPGRARSSAQDAADRARDRAPGRPEKRAQEVKPPPRAGAPANELVFEPGDGRPRSRKS